MTIRELIDNSGDWVAQAFLSFFKFWQDAFEKTASLNFLDLTILQAIALLVVSPSLIYLYYYVARVNSLEQRYWRASVKPYVSKKIYYSRLILYPIFPVLFANWIFMISVVAYWVPLLGIFEYFQDIFIIGYVSIYIWWVTLSTKEPFPAHYDEWKALIGNDYHAQLSPHDKEVDIYLKKRTMPELSQDETQLDLNSCARVYERRMYIYTDDENEENLKRIFSFLYPSDDEETNKRMLEAMENLRQKRIAIKKKALDEYKKEISSR
jgi:hypothetical protein